jgi:hypothetical protein
LDEISSHAKLTLNKGKSSKAAGRQQQHMRDLDEERFAAARFLIPFHLHIRMNSNYVEFSEGI